MSSDVHCAGSSSPGPAPRISEPVHARRATADVAAQIVGRALNLLLGIFATAVLARKLGSAGFGAWSTILLVPALLANLNDLGFSQVAVRRAAAEQDPRWIGALVSIRLALSAPTALLSMLAIVLLARGQEMLIAGIVVAAQALLAGPAALTSVFQLQARNDLGVLITTVNSVLWTGAVVLVASLGGSLVAYATALVAIAAITTLSEARIALARMRVAIGGTRALWPSLVRTAVPLSIGSLLILAYARIDGLIVYAVSGTAAAGLYGSVYRVVEQAGIVPFSLIVTLMPIVSRLYPSRVEDVRRMLQLSLELLAMFSLPAFAFALVASRPLLALLYGAHFLPAAGALPVLTAAFVPICCSFALAPFTLVLDLQRQFAWYALAALAFNLALNLALVPRYGYIAAAWTTLATELLIMGLTGRAVLRRLEMRLRFARAGRIVLAAGFSGGVTLALHRAGLGVIGLLPAAGVAHVLALLASRALSPDDVRALLRRDPLQAY